MRGYFWGAASVLLVTLAQLLIKWGMAQIPLLSFAILTPALLSECELPLLVVSGGIFCYALSMLCWFIVLRNLSLSLAYPLLSFSYAMVYLAAVMLPWFNEPASMLKSLGVLLILFGVWLISSKAVAKASEQG
jgi:undecaprenyl phosphate-alpha-L-ara4N flippase subunit ArnF